MDKKKFLHSNYNILINTTVTIQTHTQYDTIAKGPKYLIKPHKRDGPREYLKKGKSQRMVHVIYGCYGRQNHAYIYIIIMEYRNRHLPLNSPIPHQTHMRSD